MNDIERDKWLAENPEEAKEAYDLALRMKAVRPISDALMKQDEALDNKPVKIKRNDPCPCESGKKYKKCCLLQEREDKMWQQRQIMLQQLVDLKKLRIPTDEELKEFDKQELIKASSQGNSGPIGNNHQAPNLKDNKRQRK